MNARTFVIRRAFVLPLALLVILTLALLVVCVAQGQPTAKAVILAALILPLVALLVESAGRKVVVDEAGVTSRRPFRQRRVEFAAVTSLETVQVRSRVFLTLVAGDDDFLILSNSYADFPGLVAALVEAVPERTLTEETRQLALDPPKRQADVVTAWFAVIALLYVLIAQFRA